MKYSIIIPLFNCEKTVDACVMSVASIPDSEILLIDDGSSDETAARCQALAVRYPHIRLVRQENRGVSAARNRGLDLARGEYILFLDGDDTLDPRGLDAMGPADLAIFRRSDRSGWQGGGTLNCHQNLEELFQGDLLAPVWNKRFSRDMIERHDLRFREELTVYEDLEFVLRYLSFCETVIRRESPVCCHTPSSGAAMRMAALADPGPLLCALAQAGAEKGKLMAPLSEILCRESLSVHPLKIRKIWKIYRKYGQKRKFPALLWGAVKLRRRRRSGRKRWISCGFWRCWQ